jgi:hypothetical protein
VREEKKKSIGFYVIEYIPFWKVNRQNTIDYSLSNPVIESITGSQKSGK